MLEVDALAEWCGEQSQAASDLKEVEEVEELQREFMVCCPPPSTADSHSHRSTLALNLVLSHRTGAAEREGPDRGGDRKDEQHHAATL